MNGCSSAMRSSSKWHEDTPHPASEAATRLDASSSTATTGFVRRSVRHGVVHRAHAAARRAARRCGRRRRRWRGCAARAGTAARPSASGSRRSGTPGTAGRPAGRCTGRPRPAAGRTGCRPRAPSAIASCSATVGTFAGHELRREQLLHRGHVDAVEARRDDRRAGDADVDLLRPAAGRAGGAAALLSVVLRTIESSTSSTRLPCSTSRSGVYFSRTLSARLPPSMNVRPM